MLGHVVCMYIRQFHEVETVDFRFPSDDFQNFIKDYNGEYIVNCIGSIPQKTKDFSVNFELPIFLEKNSPCRIIHPSTDCEIDDNEYGISKRISTEYIVTNSINTKIIKSSIIGPEIKDHKSLFDWFLMNKSEKVQGYTDAIWNGITSLQWSKICYDLIENWDSFEILNIVESEDVSKFDLLKMLADEFNKKIEIIPVIGIGKNKALRGSIKAPSLREQIKELKKFYYT